MHVTTRQHLPTFAALPEYRGAAQEAIQDHLPSTSKASLAETCPDLAGFGPILVDSGRSCSNLIDAEPNLVEFSQKLAGIGPNLVGPGSKVVDSGQALVEAGRFRDRLRAKLADSDRICAKFGHTSPDFDRVRPSSIEFVCGNPLPL